MPERHHLAARAGKLRAEQRRVWESCARSSDAAAALRLRSRRLLLVGEYPARRVRDDIARQMRGRGGAYLRLGYRHRLRLLLGRLSAQQDG